MKKNVKKEVSLWRVLGVYWEQGKKYPLSGLIGSLSYIVAGVLVSVVSPLVYKNIIDIVSGSAPNEETFQAALGWVWILGGLMLVFQILYRIGDFVATYFESNVLRLCANVVFEKVHNHSYTFFSNNFSGALVSKAKRFIGSFVNIYEGLLWNFIMSALRILGAAGVLFFSNVFLGALYFVWIIIFVVIVVYFVRKKTPYDIAEAKMDSKTIAQYSDTVANALTLKMFATKKREFSSFQKMTSAWDQKRRKAWYMQSFQSLAQASLFFLLEFFSVLLAVLLWQKGEITVGTIVLMQIYIFGTFDALWGFSRALSNVEKSLADAKEMVEIFEEEPSVQDPKCPEVCTIQEGNIEFQNVSFVYEKNNRPVLKDFSLHIHAGEKVGLVGSSGAGKTTLTKILLRFNDIAKGEVLIDGQNITNLRQDDLRRAISYVPQEPLLFHRTLRENIAYGKPDASEEEIITVAKRAHAHEFISCLPEGYDTLVGERGVKLSGGERQRVAIARAMLKDAPILILDEATSSLDSVSERYIQEALDELMRGRTTIVVAHRLSTIQKMDRILVMEKGGIVEEGSHPELIAKKGIYAFFWDQQAGGFMK